MEIKGTRGINQKQSRGEKTKTRREKIFKCIAIIRCDTTAGVNKCVPDWRKNSHKLTSASFVRFVWNRTNYTRFPPFQRVLFCILLILISIFVMRVFFFCFLICWKCRVHKMCVCDYRRSSRSAGAGVQVQ